MVRNGDAWRSHCDINVRPLLHWNARVKCLNCIVQYLDSWMNQQNEALVWNNVPQAM